MRHKLSRGRKTPDRAKRQTSWCRTSGCPWGGKGSLRTGQKGSVALFEALLRRLVTLENESEEADRLREHMDAPWYRLSDEEQFQMRKLSGDLG